MSTLYQLSLLLTLGGLCAVLVFVLRLAKTWQLKRFAGDMTVVDRVQLDQHASLVIVSVRGKEMLVGVSQHGIHPLPGVLQP